MGAADTMNQKQKKVNWKPFLKKVQGKDAFETTCILGKKILKLWGATRPETALSGTIAYEKLIESLKKSKVPLPDFPKNTFIQYLSKAAASSGTDIFCEGRKQGYYVRKEADIPDDEDESAETSKQKGYEYQLYPVAERWLANHSFNVATIATKKKNGPWGNPDVMGVKMQEVCGQQDVEIVTIECKNSLDNWKRQIFEAVAHKRFADRVYFAFVLPVDEVEKWYGELVEYAEFYGIGLLVLEMEPKVLNRYNQRDPNIDKDLLFLEFREIYHAPRSQCLFHARKFFLEEGLEVRTANDLSRFGDSKATMGDVPDRGCSMQPKTEKKKQQKDAGGKKSGNGRGRRVGQ